MTVKTRNEKYRPGIGRLPPARLLGICLGGQVEGFLPLPLPALVFLGQAGAD